ncbi:MAG: DUF29 domain-containing protein [Alphaproteobacteria bacterium]|nr:DUF29 domain-containing protein [Alphaproteobacteria bacterium]
MVDLYDNDILTWSERQAALLRRVAAGEAPNETPDWENIVEEIESVGRSELHRTESLLIQALRHRLKIMASPDSPEVPHWQEEAVIFQMDAARAYQPAMKQRLDLAWIYRRARHRFPTQMDGQPPLPLPEICPVTLDELLSE